MSKTAILIAIGAAATAVLTVLSAPILASPIAYALSRGETVIKWDMTGLMSSNDLPAYYLSFFAGLFSTGNAWVVAAIFCLIGIAVAIGVVYFNLENPSRNVENGILGRQKSLSSPAEIMRNSSPWGGEERPTDGVVVGGLRGREIIMPCIHAAIVAPSGGGKTRGSVYETLDALTWGGENNVIATDPSLEIYLTASPCLRSRGYDVKLLDFESPLQGARFNPLKLVTDLHRTGDEAGAEARAREVGAILYPERGNENDIFVNAAGGAFSAVSYLVATLPDVPDDRRHICSVVQTVLTGSIEGPAPLKDWIRSFGAESAAVSMAATFLASEGKLESSIMASLHDGLQPYTSANMRWLTSGSDLDVAAMVRGRSAVFVHTLAPGSPTNRVAALLFAEHWAETQRLGKRRGLRPCWVIGDEWHSVPRFGLVHAIENSRKYGLHYVMYLQSLSGLDQYKTQREDGKDAILANCDLKALYRAGSDQDARYFEALGGKKTVRVRNTGESSSGIGRGTSSQGYAERDVPVWPMGDLLERDPLRDGVLVFQSAGGGKGPCKLEVPVVDVTKTATSGHFGTVGTREFEREALSRGLDELEAAAAGKSPEVRGWAPDFEALKSDATKEAEIASDEFGAWD